jgi:hypothetical protein
MTRPSIFGEGPTDVSLMRKLLAHVFDIPVRNLDKRFDVKPSGSKTQLWPTAKEVLRADIGSGIHHTVLILRDRDEGEEIEKILKEFTDGFKDLLREEQIEHPVSFKNPFPGIYPNLFASKIYVEKRVDVQLLLHIAAHPDLQVSLEGYPFNASTTDHYVFAAALTKKVLHRFADRAGITDDALLSKVVDEIPNLLRNNGITNIGIKDILSCYMTASRFLKIAGSERAELLTEIVVARAIKYDQQEFERIFASHIAAIKLLQQEETAI